MAAHADDLRYFYAETLGDTVEITVSSGGPSKPLLAALSPGRYIIRVVAYGGGNLWVRQGAFGSVTATPAPPSTEFVGHTDLGFLQSPLLVVMVRNEDDNGLAFWGAGGTPVVQVTKVSRDKR
jgi:hypothetical protein